MLTVQCQGCFQRYSLTILQLIALAQAQTCRTIRHDYRGYPLLLQYARGLTGGTSHTEGGIADDAEEVAKKSEEVAKKAETAESAQAGAENAQTGAESKQTGAESAQRMIRVEAMIDSFFTNAIRSDARRNMVATLDCLMRHPEYSAAKVAKELGLSQSATQKIMRTLQKAGLL